MLYSEYTVELTHQWKDIGTSTEQSISSKHLFREHLNLCLKVKIPHTSCMQYFMSSNSLINTRSISL